MRFTQVEAAKNLGWSQGAISHYLSNITDLGPAAVIKFANFLNVDPLEIDPSIQEYLPTFDRYDVTMRSSDATSTKKIIQTNYITNQKESIYCMLEQGAVIEHSDVDLMPYKNLNGYAHLVNLKTYKQARVIAVRLKTEKQLRFYRAAQLPKASSIHTLWAVISFTYTQRDDVI
jgi:transcriptional regulator with XRE-family HTH domain